MNVASVCEYFPVTRKCTYLDDASLSLVPRQVEPLGEQPKEREDELDGSSPSFAF
ncbi:MAG: hypothetical protein ACLQME_17945 [Alphaproteobacteria bacterium]